MIHLGDITKIDGYNVPIVDCVVGGSPCQDLSVAGKRAGLDGERSGLFMEQVRIAKEMRKRDETRIARALDLPNPIPEKRKVYDCCGLTGGDLKEVKRNEK